MPKTRKTSTKTIDPSGLTLDFSQSPTVYRFLQSNNFIRGLIGCVGSGKSYACAAEIMLRAVKQQPSPIDNVRYSRFAVVRNSYPMLKTTTIKTWQELFPESIWGPINWTPPITHHIRLPARQGAAGIDCEVIFMAFDQPQRDIKRLLSLELTGAWVNECRELPVALVQGLSHRVGRYPTKRDGGTSWRGIWFDSNPCDTDHYLYRMQQEKVLGDFSWKFFQQPPGVVQVDVEELPENPEANDHTFAAGKWWKINAKAENLNNLPTGYYHQMLPGKDLDWIRCYAAGEYVFVRDGKPVWEEYNDQMMSGTPEYDNGLPLQVGLDFGLTPAAVIGQRHPSGLWTILHEVVSFDMGLERFAHQLLADLNLRFPKAELKIFGDPAGMARDSLFEKTSFDFLRTLGLNAQPAPSNNFKVRRESGAAPMTRLIKSKPGLLVHVDCKRLRKALSGGYHFKRVNIGAGQERFRDVPNKNEHSHVADAYGYLTSGGGEHRRMTRSPSPTFTDNNQRQTNIVAGYDWDVFSF